MPAAQTSKSGGKKSWFWWIVGAIALIIIIVVIMMIVRNSGSNSTPTASLGTATGAANLPLPAFSGSGGGILGGGLPLPGSAPGGLFNPFNALNPLATIGSGLGNLFHF